MPDLVFTSRGHAEVLRNQTLVNERAAELKQIYADDARAARELEQAAARIFKNTQHPAKQFNEEMGRLLGNYKQGKLNAEQYEKAVKRLEETYRETQTLGGKLKATVGAMFGPNVLKQALAFAGGVASIHGAVALLRSEYAATLALIDKTNAKQLDVSQARNVVIRNLLGESPATIQKTLGQIGALSTELKIPEEVLATAFAEAVSAAGGKIPDALSALRLGARFLGDQPQEIGGFAGSLIDLQKATGSADQRVNFGLLAKIGQLSRVATPQQIAQNAPKALIGATGFGATPQEAAALYSTLTQLFDAEGRAASTAQVQLAKQLFFFSKNLRKIGRDDAATQLDGLTMGGRIAMLQQNPELARLFLEGQPGPGGFSAASFESQFVAPIRGLLLDPRARAASTLRDFTAQTPGNAGLAALAEEAMGNFRLNEFEPIAQRQRSILAWRDQLRLRGRPQLGAEEREAVQEGLQQLGGSNVGTRLRTFIGSLSDRRIGVSTEDALQLLQGEQQRLLRGRPMTTPAGTFTPGRTDYLPPSVEDKENAKLLGQVIDFLSQMVEAQKETNRKLDEGGLIGGSD